MYQGLFLKWLTSDPLPSCSSPPSFLPSTHIILPTFACVYLPRFPYSETNPPFHPINSGATRKVRRARRRERGRSTASKKPTRSIQNPCHNSTAVSSRAGASWGVLVGAWIEQSASGQRSDQSEITGTGIRTLCTAVALTRHPQTQN
jgi:hypothetical protein